MVGSTGTTTAADGCGTSGAAIAGGPWQPPCQGASGGGSRCSSGSASAARGGGGEAAGGDDIRRRTAGLRETGSELKSAVNVAREPGFLLSPIQPPPRDTVWPAEVRRGGDMRGNLPGRPASPCSVAGPG